ncbi:MAG TPA: alginate export family protein [Alphaproteobacteria bacterium]|nr:alginate export family protein [Alphaproteobacteria bacterium]
MHTAEAEILFPEVPLEIGGHLELSYEGLRNTDLDGADDDDLDALQAEFELELLYAPSERFEAYLRVQLTEQSTPQDEGDQSSSGAQLILNEAYVTLTVPASDMSLRLGRQLFEDERQWLYDAELDAVRGRYADSRSLLELSASEKALLAEEDLLNSDEEESITNLILYGIRELTPSIGLGGFVVAGENRDAADTRTLLFGLTSRGKVVNGLEYWADAGLLRGEDQGANLRGYGFDLLASYRIDAPLRPRLLVGYAFGSGDPDPEGGADRGFRQTGLQDNEAKLGGLADFKYLGEVFDPELANLSVLTAGIGVHPRDDLSIDLAYHRYLQDDASEEISSSILEAEATGESRRLGSEIDLVVGYEPLDHVSIRGFFGCFLPGSAFENGADEALLARLEIEFGL